MTAGHAAPEAGARRYRRGGHAAGAAAARRRDARSAARITSIWKARSPWPFRGEDDEITSIPRPSTPARSSTWSPSALGVPSQGVVTVEVRRMGGAFGGKETQADLFRRAVRRAGRQEDGAPGARLRPDRDDDMIDDRQASRLPESTTRWASTTTADRRRRRSPSPRAAASRPTSPGRSTIGRCSMPTTPITWRTSGLTSQPLQDQHGLQHRLPRLRRPAGHGRRRAGDRGDRLRAGQGSAGGPQAEFLRPASATSRPTTRPSRTTSLDEIIEGAGKRPADYAAAARRGPRFNAESRMLKRGLALTPVKFGISFTTTHLQPGRRAGARLHRRHHAPEPRRHRDGAGALHQGRAGGRRGVPGRHRPTSRCTAATTTGKVPNTSATAASSGSDLNGMAAQAAARTIKGG